MRRRWSWLNRFLPWLPRRDDWPSGVPPTVSGPAPTFHCHACKQPVRDDERSCSRCGAQLT